MGTLQSRQPRQPPARRAWGRLYAHPLLGALCRHVQLLDRRHAQAQGLPPRAWCVLEGETRLVHDEDARLDEAQWLAVFAVAVLVLAVGAPRRFLRRVQVRYGLDRLELPHPSAPQVGSPAHTASVAASQAAQLAALVWWHELRVGDLPDALQLPADLLALGHEDLAPLAHRLAEDPPAGLADGTWTLTRSRTPLLQAGPLCTTTVKHARVYLDPAAAFAQALVDQASRALALQRTERRGAHGTGAIGPPTKARQAWRWLVNHHPLLGAVLARFELVEDAEVCDRLRVGIGAVSVATGEIYLHPHRHLDLDECIFVLAHEALHAGLDHAGRRQGRHPQLWNVACDFVINDWLIEMGLGRPPTDGGLVDPTLRGRSAEDIYLVLAADLRLLRRLQQGKDAWRQSWNDLLDNRATVDGIGVPGGFSDRAAWCRAALLQGLDFHESSCRGHLPAGLVESIRTLAQPPIPWQTHLAQWLQARFPLPELRRSWARPSRRQAATPDIPRPRLERPEEDRHTRTFGVVVDSSGSMDRADLGKALGAIVAYAGAQEVREVRLVYCDAQPYDEGYVAIEALAERVRVRGRGGTVLQGAIDLLQTRPDFPPDGPILVITDGEIEANLTIRRDHAFLLTGPQRLPFDTRQPVFVMR